MSTTASPVATAAANAPVAPVVHQSFWSKAATWLLRVGRDIKSGIGSIVGAAAKIAPIVQAEAPTVEAISEAIVPGSSIIENAALAVFGHVVKAINDAGAAVSSVSITTPAGSLALDQQLIADIKALIPSLAAKLPSNAGPTASTAPPPTSSAAVVAASK